MAPTDSHVLPRDAGSGTDDALTTGAIAGIAGGAGALFLSAAGLFFLYWRRQRKFDREDSSDAESLDYHGHPWRRSQRAVIKPAVAYTMDYKHNNPQHHEGATFGAEPASSTGIYSPEKGSSAFSSFGSPPGSASAMPTHPAYVPRALVRGASTPSTLSRSTAATSPPPFPSPPYLGPLSSAPTTQADDPVIQAFFRAAGGEAGARGQGTQNFGAFSQSRQTPPPPLNFLSTTPNTTSATPQHPPPTHQPSPSRFQPRQARKPRLYVPPPLSLNPVVISNTNPSPPVAADGSFATGGTIPRLSEGGNPLPGREGTAISDPLAFPELHPHHLPPNKKPTRPRRDTRTSWARDEVFDDDDGDERHYADDDGGPDDDGYADTTYTDDDPPGSGAHQRCGHHRSQRQRQQQQQ
ncbi:hypothetical protein VTJ83DRAFT_5658 [Remersonia thermophila]|uniref:Uncharacterized protein n=1 Tax=Remersonia thermophila TaxID=72144 RepID=A0ABR4D7I4_9PEZI